MRRLKILTWNIHGAYLNALCQAEHDWFLPVKRGSSEGYGGRGDESTLPSWVQDVPADQVRNLDLDLVVYQTPSNYFEDAPAVLDSRHQSLPAVYLEHNTPRPYAATSRHPVADAPLLLVHVTHYNQLMWDNGETPTLVIEHSVAIDPTVRYEGSIPTGIVVVNNIDSRTRATGFDIFQQARESIPLTIAGMGSEYLGGLGDIPYRQLHRAIAPYRFLFSPMRYTSLPLAVIEAMTIGMPVVALATTELPSVIEDGVTGFISCQPAVLVDRMHDLLHDHELAQRLGANGRRVAENRFGMPRFIADWNRAFDAAIDIHRRTHRDPDLLLVPDTEAANGMAVRQ